MDELAELYRDVIVEHAQHPRHHGRLDGPDVVWREGYNPLCGDRVTVYLDVADGVVRRAAFTGEGCAISTAAASLITDAVVGRTVEEARALFARYREALTTPDDAAALGAAVELGELAALIGVRAYPMRIKCATLAGHTLGEALDAVGAEAPNSGGAAPGA